MTFQRSIAFALIALEAGALIRFGEGLLVPLAVLPIAALGATGRFRVNLERKARLLLALALAVAVLTLRNFEPVGGPAIHIILDGFGTPIAQFFIGLQLIELYARQPRGLPARFALYGVLALTATGDIIASTSTSDFYHAISLAFMALAALYFASSRPPAQTRRPCAYSLATGAFLGAALALAFATSLVLAPYRGHLDGLLIGMVEGMREGTRIGFDANSSLGSIEGVMTTHENRIALRIDSKRVPGYLRGRVYTSFLSDNWFVSIPNQRFRPSRRPAGLPPQEEGENVFSLWNTERETYRETLEIAPSEVMGRVLFMTLDTAWVGIPHEWLRINPLGIVETEISETDLLVPYSVYTADTRPIVPLSAEERRIYLQYPADTNPAVMALAKQICQGQATPREKIDAVLAYLRANYDYGLGIDIPEGADPIAYFLTEKPPAHCEYFATGAALLLRIVGVPCRYVAGFLVTEQNLVGGYWIARNKDAHAWVEAYDEGTGWFTIDPTPPVGRPLPGRPPQLAYLWDHLGLHLERLGQARVHASIEGLASGLFAMAAWVLVMAFTTLPGLAAVASMGLLALIGYCRRCGPRPATLFTPHDPALATLLRRADKSLGKKGVVRRSTETLNQFAERIRREPLSGGGEAGLRASVWYTRFAGLRYGGAPKEDDVDELRRSVPRL